MSTTSQQIKIKRVKQNNTKKGGWVGWGAEEARRKKQDRNKAMVWEGWESADRGAETGPQDEPRISHQPEKEKPAEEVGSEDGKWENSPRIKGQAG